MGIVETKELIKYGKQGNKVTWTRGNRKVEKTGKQGNQSRGDVGLYASANRAVLCTVLACKMRVI